MNALNAARLSLLGLSLACSNVFAVEYLSTEDYTAISIEAETFVSKDERWVLTNAATGQLPAEEDPDPNHSDTASGGVYFELLPDTRVTHEDPVAGGFWGPPGLGPQMSWDVVVPEPGRYYIHGRAYSTGTEDNGIHIGFDGTWPISGRILQFCTAGKRAWAWSSNKRDSGGGSCGIAFTSFLDFETAGPHTISVSAREDGFELDKFMLIKDLSNNTRICAPNTANNISCRNGSIEMVDEQTDLAVELETTPDTVANGSDELSAGSSFTVTAVLQNLDNFDPATEVVVRAEFADGLEVTSVPESCVVGGQIVMCNIESLNPTSEENSPHLAFEVSVLETGDQLRSIDVNVENSVFDGNFANNSASVEVQVAVIDLSTDIGVTLSLLHDAGSDDPQWTTGELGSLLLSVENTSDNLASTVDVNVALSSGIEVDLLPAACNGVTNLVCSFPLLGSGETRDLQIDISATGEGVQVLTASTAVANDNNTSNDRDTFIAVINPLTLEVIADETIEEPADLPDSEPNTESEETVVTSAVGGSGSSGAVSWQALLALLLLASASVYWRHQRKPIAVR